MSSYATSPCDEGVIRSGAAGPPCSGRWVLAAAILGSSLAFIDATAVNVALPALQSALKGTISDVQWVVEAYALFLSALLLTGGSLGDRFGRRRIFVIGVVVFALASMACGCAPTIAMLVASRALQGVGGALLVPGSLALISVSFPADTRGRAIGTWSGFTSITAAIGPVLGGWLSEHLSWRWIFFLNVPIAIVVVMLSYWRVPETRGSAAGVRLDWLGTALATVGLGGCVYGIIESRFLAVGIGVVALVIFVFAEARVREPMLPLALFRSPSFLGANLLTLFLYAGLAGVLFFFPLNLVQIQGYSPTQAGAALLPFIVLMFLLSRWSGGLIVRYGARVPLIVGPLVAGAGFLVFAIAGVGGAYWTTFFPAVAVLGVGMAISVAPLTTTVMSSVPQRHVGIASGTNNAVSRIAGLVAIAVFGVVLKTTFDHGLDRRLESLPLPAEVRERIEDQKPRLGAAQIDDPRARRAIAEAFVEGYRRVLWIAAALSLAGALSSALLVEKSPRAVVHDRARGSRSRAAAVGRAGG